MLKQYFEDNGINIKKFAQKHNLDYLSTIRVIKGEYLGKYKAKKNTRAVYEKLLELKIIDEMPRACS
ncbi:hypothetical protein ACQ73V_001897 [Campylobacter coli]|nr:hypothetical protein [Campylobacter coli]EJR6039862.1 hypothetical protein [Campylobacter jejuni]EKA0346158.1 hypothetical protein [Campylobacter coli]EKD4541020.1 hypothetical protein [Campylobacter coli]EKK2351339.1 hypothetical protein [Campylobacter coli]